MKNKIKLLLFLIMPSTLVQAQETPYESVIVQIVQDHIVSAEPQSAIVQSFTTDFGEIEVHVSSYVEDHTLTGWIATSPACLTENNICQQVEINSLLIQMTLKPKLFDENNDNYLYSSINAEGEIRFRGKATQFWPSSKIFDFDATRSYKIEGGLGQIVYSKKLGRVIHIDMDLPYGNAYPRLYKLIHNYGLLDTLGVRADLPDGWVFDFPYDLYQVYPAEVKDSLKPSLAFYNINRYSISPFFLGGAAPKGDGSPVKICADGSKDATLISISGSVDEGSLEDITVRIKEDPSGSNPEVYGTFTHSSSAADSVIFVYEHPNALDVNTLYKEIHLEVVREESGGSVLATYPLHIYRAPVVMLHGIWSNSTTFSEMIERFVQSGHWSRDLLHSFEYGNTADRCFSENHYIAFNAVRTMILNAVRAGYSSNRVNVVAHSMGGVLTRMFIQSDEYDDHIARFITLNTPHSGSQMANYLLEDPVGRLVGQALYNLQPRMDPFNGAVADLQVDSRAYELINKAPYLNKNSIPSHVIVTEAIITDVIKDDWVKWLLLYIASRDPRILAAGLAVDAALSAFLTDLFDGEHDIIVAATSQEGGLDRKTSFFRRWHIESPNDEEVFQEVNLLLSVSPEHGLFSRSGFTPPRLRFDLAPAPPLAKADIGTGSSMNHVTISDPLDGTIVAAGSSIQVSVAGSIGITKILLAAASSAGDIHSDLQVGNSATFNYQIPESASALIKVMAYGFDDSGNVAIDSISLNVNIPANLDSVAAFPNVVYFSPGQKASIVVKGHFDDGVVRDLTYNGDVTYQIVNDNIARIIRPGLIEALSDNSTIAKVTYDGKSSDVEVVVLPIRTGVGVKEKDSLPTGLPVTAELLQNYPNPFNPTTTIQYDLSTDSIVALNVYDMLGRKVAELVKGWNARGQHEVVFNGSGLPSGVYLYRLELGERVITQKLVLAK